MRKLMDTKFEHIEDSDRLVSQVLDAEIAGLPEGVARDRIMLAGFSQGKGGRGSAPQELLRALIFNLGRGGAPQELLRALISNLGRGAAPRELLRALTLNRFRFPKSNSLCLVVQKSPTSSYNS